MLVMVIKVVMMKVVIVAGGEFLKPPCEWSSIVCPSLVALSVEQGPAENKGFKFFDFYNLKSIYGWLSRNLDVNFFLARFKLIVNYIK